MFVTRRSRRDLLRRLSALAGLGAASAALMSCGGGASAPAPSQTAPPPPPAGGLALGAHSLVYSRAGVSVAPLSTPAMRMQTTGSTVLVCVGRGAVADQSIPTDSNANGYVQTGSPHVYTLWPTSGTALYVCAQAVGAANVVVTASKPNPTDETTLAAVEVINGGVVREVKWNEVLAGNPLTSLSVTTTGPAMLVAWWWGDADVAQNKTAVPDNGFTVIDAILLEGALVQCAVAVRRVTAAGTYNVTWASTPRQGAQLWIAAIEAAV